ncbi:wax ester synthase/diacylglycerol acyltransferase 4-like [Impatiens glandulifera]|uniref:wax ester synthase/diacylglycerol acyltransferase 4-like n=1 Tax=Impatiens glandulifera TaxID=253017 RepID=UPI001FB19A14|nr:wax ester synthase/diacylglycerol acyltransferase 4-like [Impatiens glandulifera]
MEESMTTKIMIEADEEADMREPVSPTGQFFNSSVLSISIIAVMESQVPIDDALTMTLLKDVFLPINPRFSSVMETDKNGVKQWKKVKVNLIDHVNVPVFRAGESPEFYEDQFNNYLSELALQELPRGRPLWEIHIIKYPTRSVAGNLIFKLHHALGDGFSLMGALLSCLQRADNPNLPLTFPNIRGSEPKLGSTDGKQGIFPRMGNVFSIFFNTISDFGFGLVKSALVGDGSTPVRSGDSGVEFNPIDICTVTFGLDQLKRIKSNLQVTINDVITGIVFLGTRLYMKETKSEKFISTALVLLNTRNIAGYSSVEEMVKPDKNTQWGNQFGFLHVTLPCLDESEPLQFVFEARKIIQRKRKSGAVFLTGKLLELLRKYRGPEVAARYIHGTLRNCSMTLSNLIGPVEQCSLADHPCAGMYFMVVGIPQNLTITMISYMGQMKIAVGTERKHINSQKFKSCIQTAFDVVFKAAVG